MRPSIHKSSIGFVDNNQVYILLLDTTLIGIQPSIRPKSTFSSNILIPVSFCTMVRFTSLALAFAACLPAIMAHPANGPRSSTMGCGTAPTAEFLAKSEEFAALEANSTGKAGFSVAATTTIQTYFHVIARSSAASDGYIPQASLIRQS
jgi:hypothetical protein